MTPAPTLPRELLAQALGNPRLVSAFEQQAQAVSETQQQGAENVAATSALQDATFVTLSPNDTLTGERVLEVGPGISIEITADKVKLNVSDEVPHVQGGFPVYLTAQNPVNLVLPQSGTVATRSEPEVLSNKTLQAPRLATIGSFADDAAAAAGGVPVGGVYRTGSALKVRIA
jgi:hypothetical protein